MVRKNIFNAKFVSRAGAFGVGLSLLVTAAPVYAVDSAPMPHHPAARASSQPGTVNTQNKLDDNKRKVCEQRVEAIRKIAKKAAERGEDQLSTTDRISQRTQNFYLTKKLTVTNYAQLVNDVATKRAAVVAAIRQVRVGANVNCSGNDPKAQGQIVRANIQSMQNAVKQYKTAVKTLVTTVQTAAKAASK